MPVFAALEFRVFKLQPSNVLVFAFSEVISAFMCIAPVCPCMGYMVFNSITHERCEAYDARWCMYTCTVVHVVKTLQTASVLGYSRFWRLKLLLYI